MAILSAPRTFASAAPRSRPRPQAFVDPEETPLDRAAQAGEGLVQRAVLTVFTQLAEEFGATGDTNQAILQLAEAALHWLFDRHDVISAEHVADLERALAATGQRAARAAPNLDSRAAVGMRWDIVDEDMVHWAAQHSATLVQDIDATTRSGIRASVAQAYQHGQTVQQTAKLIQDMIGLTDRDALRVGRRVGDLIDMGARPQAALRIATDLADELVRQRALLIARTETINAANAGTTAAWERAAEQGLLPPDRRRTWIAAGDELTCPICSELNGQVVAMAEPFQSALVGPIMMPTAHPACRCSMGLVFSDQFREPVWFGSPHQPRDKDGKWTKGGGGMGGGHAKPGDIDHAAVAAQFGPPAHVQYTAGNRQKAGAILGVPEDKVDGMIHRLAGGQAGARIDVKVYGGGELQIDSLTTVGGKDGKQVKASRNLVRFDDGVLGMENQSLAVKNAPRGTGTAIFLDGARAGKELGAEYIGTYAARSKTMNGYYTWPRLGYRGTVKGPDGKTEVADLMATPEGRSWWKANGKSTRLDFDLTDGSDSWKVLEAYARSKGLWDLAPAANTRAAAEPTPGDNESTDDEHREELPDDELDDDTLDAIWDDLNPESPAPSGPTSPPQRGSEPPVFRLVAETPASQKRALRAARVFGGRAVGPFVFFNPGQKRDKQGRWTRGGGGEISQTLPTRKGGIPSVKDATGREIAVGDVFTDADGTTHSILGSRRKPGQGAKVTVESQKRDGSLKTQEYPVSKLRPIAETWRPIPKPEPPTISTPRPAPSPGVTIRNVPRPGLTPPAAPGSFDKATATGAETRKAMEEYITRSQAEYAPKIAALTAEHTTAKADVVRAFDAWKDAPSNARYNAYAAKVADADDIHDRLKLARQGAANDRDTLLERFVYHDTPSKIDARESVRLKPTADEQKEIAAFKRLAGNVEAMSRVDIRRTSEELRPSVGRQSAYYSRTEKTAYLKPTNAPGTFVHELGHHYEYEQYGLHDEAKLYREHYATGSRPEKLKDITGMNYHDSEVAYRGTYADSYMGKVYNHNSTEVVSMAMQLLYVNPARLAREAPDTFDWTIDILKGRRPLTERRRQGNL